MGYESKLYIVEKFKGSLREKDKGKAYVQVIAMFDMCKFYELSGVLTKQPETDCYFYADDGNTKILEDKYGDPLTESSIELVIEVLEEIVENGEDYRRIFPLLSALKTFKEQKDKGIWKNIAVLHYGY
jgi:hypothetical protein